MDLISEMIADACVDLLSEMRRRCGDGHPVEFFSRTLGRRIEFADFVDFISKEIEANRSRCGDRINVDDSAADRIFAGRLADDLAVVIERIELFEKIGKNLFVAGFERDLLFPEIFRRREFLQKSPRSCDDDERRFRVWLLANFLQTTQNSQTLNLGFKIPFVFGAGKLFRKKQNLKFQLGIGQWCEKLEIVDQPDRELWLRSDQDRRCSGSRSNKFDRDSRRGRWADAGDGNASNIFA